MIWRRRWIFVAVAGCLILYPASLWWERAFATLEYTEISPDKCFRIDTYRAFRVLPSIFHRAPHPDPSSTLPLGEWWQDVVFKRAYEVRTGQFLGETVIFDPAMGFGVNFWNESRQRGRRIVAISGFRLFDSDRCADDETLARLKAFYEGERRLAPADL